MGYSIQIKKDPRPVQYRSRVYKDFWDRELTRYVSGWDAETRPLGVYRGINQPKNGSPLKAYIVQEGQGMPWIVPVILDKRTIEVYYIS
jgi:hypothetical protein